MVEGGLAEGIVFRRTGSVYFGGMCKHSTSPSLPRRLPNWLVALTTKKRF